MHHFERFTRGLLVNFWLKCRVCTGSLAQDNLALIKKKNVFSTMYTAASQKYLNIHNTQVNQLKAMTFPFWIIRLSSHVLKVPLCMLNFSVTDRNRFFNSWVVSKRDINNKLIKKQIYSKKYVFRQALLTENLCVHTCCYFLNGLQIICV